MKLYDNYFIKFKSSLFYRIFLFSLLLLGFSVANGQNLDSLTEIINNNYQTYIDGFKNQDAKLVANVYTIDGTRAYPGGSQVNGRKAILDEITRYLSRTGSVHVNIKIQDLWILDKNIYETGTWKYSHKNDSGNTVDSQGKYFGIWKIENGQWKLWMDISLP